MRRQREHLLVAGQLPHVEIQVMPMDREEHAGVAGAVHIRDSKDVGGPQLAFAPAARAGFLPYAVEG